MAIMPIFDVKLSSAIGNSVATFVLFGAMGSVAVLAEFDVCTTAVKKNSVVLTTMATRVAADSFRLCNTTNLLIAMGPQGASIREEWNYLCTMTRLFFSFALKKGCRERITNGCTKAKFDELIDKCYGFSLRYLHGQFRHSDMLTRHAWHHIVDMVLPCIKATMQRRSELTLLALAWFRSHFS